MSEPLLGWHAFFMGVAILASARSKDFRTRNGACVVAPGNRIVGVGYNGLPRGCDDADPDYWLDDDSDPFRSRHSYIVHAEINAILNCVVLPLNGASLYATQFPCPKCAHAVIQSGIGRVIFLRDKAHHERYNLAVNKMFADAGIEVVALRELDADAYLHIQGLASVLPASGGNNDTET